MLEPTQMPIDRGSNNPVFGPPWNRAGRVHKWVTLAGVQQTHNGTMIESSNAEEHSSYMQIQQQHQYGQNKSSGRSTTSSGGEPLGGHWDAPILVLRTFWIVHFSECCSVWDLKYKKYACSLPLTTNPIFNLNADEAP